VKAQIKAEWTQFSVKLLGLYEGQKERQNETPIRFIFNPLRIPEMKKQAGLLSLQTDFKAASGTGATKLKRPLR